MTAAFPFVTDERVRHRQEGTWPGGELERTGPTGCMWRMLGLPPLLLLWSQAGSAVSISVACAGFWLAALLCCAEVLYTEKHQDGKCRTTQ